MSERRDQVALLTLWIGVLLLLFRPHLHGMDTVAYFSWLRSAIIQGSLDVSDEFERFGYLSERERSPTGYRINEWPIGPALLWSPFFLAAHSLVHVAHAVGIPIPADGYSLPYRVFPALGSALYVLIGLELLRRMASRVASSAVAFWATITAWLASPLIFYMSAHPFMAHAVDFFMNALFWWRWMKADPPGIRSRFWLGWMGGLATSVRYQNITLLIWPALEDLSALLRQPRQAVLRGMMLGVGAWIGFLPQMIVWRVVFGDWVVVNPYGIAGAGSFDWRSPNFLNVLFSTDRGLFLWTPMAAMAVVGLLGPLRHQNRKWAWFFLAQGLVQVYMVGSWSSWSGAAAFGPRLLIGLIPAFGLGLAALYEAGRKSWGMKPMIALSLTAILWNLILLARYGVQDVPRMGPVPLRDLWLGQFTFPVRAFERMEVFLRALIRQGP
ncbi:hypothetical protein [Thermoflexus sp.]|uniref:hypothetical protein n=1 Tax=Thermoflexus sp. TaxID=1969742 RepID=UPI0025F9A06F|nr:hypothetical protein [Thermoflexus sp.]MCS6963419.1 hypothetical protein [Thermoflexus sp.]MCX7689837.1 hypothetical protein [Thermoflexus sp.]MDW8183675.1 hypothetical protein [Anaerolineae bacterium]